MRKNNHMTTTHELPPLDQWLRDNAQQLDTIDPSADLDDLSALADMTKNARVVAIGENSHFIREFAHARHRLVRYLVERCGYTAVAFESGFSEGFDVDAWLHGTGSADDLDELAESSFPSGTARPREVRDMLSWLRDYNQQGSIPVHFLGVDVPEAAGSVINSLDPVITYAEKVDDSLLPPLMHTRDLAEITAGRTMAQAAPRYLEMPDDQQDALTASLSRLIDYVDCVADKYIAANSRESFDIARWHLEAARSGDHHLRAIAGAYDGTSLPAAATARERFMAESVRWWLDRLDPDTKIVLLAHNAHIQRTPVVYDGEIQVYPMGYHLARMLGEQYAAVGVTSSAGTTAALEPDGTSEPYGFAVQDVPLAPPEAGSVEAAFTKSDAGLSLANLRALRNDMANLGEQPDNYGPDRTRMDSAYIHTPIAAAFDAMLHVPTSNVAEDLGF